MRFPFRRAKSTAFERNPADLDSSPDADRVVAISRLLRELGRPQQLDRVVDELIGLKQRHPGSEVSAIAAFSLMAIAASSAGPLQKRILGELLAPQRVADGATVPRASPRIAQPARAL